MIIISLHLGPHNIESLSIYQGLGQHHIIIQRGRSLNKSVHPPLPYSEHSLVLGILFIPIVRNRDGGHCLQPQCDLDVTPVRVPYSGLPTRDFFKKILNATV